MQAVTPYDVLASIGDFILQSGEPGDHWEYVRKWCLVAGQANATGKSKVFLDTTPVTVNDEAFYRWVGTRLDIAFGPRPATSAAPAAGMIGNRPAMDFLALSKMLSTTIGTNMKQFSQTGTPTVVGFYYVAGATEALCVVLHTHLPVGDWMVCAPGMKN